MPINWDKIMQNAASMDNGAYQSRSSAQNTGGINWDKIMQNAASVDAGRPRSSAAGQRATAAPTLKEIEMSTPGYTGPPTQKDINKLYQDINDLKSKRDTQRYDKKTVDKTSYYNKQIAQKEQEIADLAKRVPDAQLKTSGLRAYTEPFAAGVQDFTSSAYSALEAGANALDTVIPENILSKGIHWIYQQDQAGQREVDKNLKEAQVGRGDAFKTYQQVGTGVGQALPSAALAVATGGASAAAQLPATANAGLAATVQNSLTAMSKSPMFKLSFVQNYGNAYSNAKAGGATEGEAQLTAILTGLINSAIEVTGGVETLPAALRSGKASVIKEWVTSALSEGKEEVVQGVIERLTQKMIYDKDKPLASVKDQNAVFNPVTSAQEFGGGTVVGGILSGGQVLAQSAINATQPAVPKSVTTTTSSLSPNVLSSINNQIRKAADLSQIEQQAFLSYIASIDNENPDASIQPRLQYEQAKAESEKAKSDLAALQNKRIAELNKTDNAVQNAPRAAVQQTTISPTQTSITTPTMQTNSARGIVAAQNDMQNAQNTYITPPPKSLPTSSAYQYNYNPDVQSINEKTWYHGSGAQNLVADKLSASASKIEGLLGSGVYLTDNQEVAQGYAKSRGKRTGTPTTYEANVNLDNVLDMSKPMPQKIYDYFDTIASYYENEYGYSEEYEALKNAQNSGKSGVEVFRKFSEFLSDISNGEGIPLSEFYDDFDYISSGLVDSGYEAYTHEGGKIAGNKQHQVLVLIDPKGELGGRNNYVTKFQKVTPSQNAGLVNAEQAPDGLGAADLGFDVTGNRLNALTEKYGTIKPGESPVTTERVVELPTQTSDANNLSQTVRTAMEAPVTTNETAEKIEPAVLSELFSYEKITDKQAVSNAENTIKNVGWDQALVSFKSDALAGKVSKDLTALGWTLYNNAANSGNAQQAVDVLVDIVKTVRSGAQSTQAVRLLKKMEPQYQLYAAQRSVQNLQDELIQKYGNKAPNIKIDEGLAQEYLDALTAKDDARAKSAMDNIYKNIASQVPATFADKWNAWRYTSMLFNPVTHIRNIASNYVFRTERFIKNTLSASVQTIAKKAGAQFEQTRSVALTRADRPLIEAALTDYANVVDSVMKYGKYDEAKNKIQEYRKIFGTGKGIVSKTVGKGVEWARKFNTEALESEDNWVSKPAYAKALAGYLKANNATMETADTGLLDRARGFAIAEAQKATYRDSNSFSDFVSNLRYRGNKPVGKAANVLGEGVLPFRRTPANILVRGLEYSPIGLAKTLTYDSYQLAKGEITASEYIDNLSSGLTGTALTGMGVLLASLGILTVGTTGDDKEDKLSQTQGKQYFALQIGGKSFTIDWLTPAMMPVFLGASLYNTKTDQSEDGAQIKDVLKIASDITAPMLETSMLQSLNDYLEGFGYAKQNDQNLMTYAVSQAALSYLGQSVPSIGGRIARTIDDTRRTSLTNPKGQLPGDVQYFLQGQVGKIPFAEETKQPYVDQWGRTQSSGGIGQRLIQNFVSPGYLKDVNVSPMETEILRLYKDYAKEHEIGVLPPVSVRKYFSNNGEDIYMNANEYTQYKKTYGQNAYKELTNLTSSASYKNMTDEDKAKAVSKIYSASAELAKTNVMESRGDMRIPSVTDGAKIQGYVDMGISQKNAYSLYKTLDELQPEGDNKSVTTYQKVNAILKQNIANNQKIALIGAFYTTKEDGKTVKESLLPYLNNATRLISLYAESKSSDNQNGDYDFINMTIPEEFSYTPKKPPGAKVQMQSRTYTLTQAEKNIFKKTYTEYFNSRINSLATAEQIKKLDSIAYEAAKMAVIRGRG